ncbi:MAG: hemerythrin domain-containing protein [Acidobacteriota bacterium]|nr:hemerythrin domain-containing protein [Acidobacteriota bacterium]
MRLTRISGGGETPTESPLDLLLGCHARIRYFVQLGRTLANAEGECGDEVSNAAAAIYRYFTVALPLHEADENLTLFPRLRAALPSGNLVRQAAETMVEQHRVIDELVGELQPLCSTLDRNPGRLPTLAQNLHHVMQAMEQIFAAHLHLEETVLFPALPQMFAAEEMAAMLAEMQERRRTPENPADRNSIHLVR